jgi:HEAT repeat protein
MSVREWLGILSDHQAADRAVAAMMLGAAPKGHARALDALRRGLDDDDDDVAEAAAASLAQHGDTDSLESILGRLRSGRPIDRWGSAWAAAELAEDAPANQRRLVTQALVTYHKRARGRSRQHAAILLGRLGIEVTP